MLSWQIREDMDHYQFIAESDKFMKGSMEGDPVDLKLSVCRGAGHGLSNLVAKKITWRDQVALRVLNVDHSNSSIP